VSCYELGHQPLNLASPLATLREAGYAPIAVDTSLDTPSDDDIKAAQFVAISVPMHTAMRLGQHVARRVRSVNPEAHICFYGLYATLNADYLLQHDADSVLSGEYEEPLLNLVQALEGTTSAGRHVPGMAPNIAKIPFAVPERASLPRLDRYARFRSNGTLALAGYTETSRGCLHTCRHCPITPVYEGRFFVVPRDVVLADIRQQVEMGARHITFGDPDFLNGPGHALAIVRRMRREFPQLTFDATIKIEHILEFRSYIPELKSLGCAFVVSAVESVSDLVLDKLKKDHTRADVVLALQIMEEAGIPLRPSFVAFTPWTTLGDYLDVLEFVAARGLVRHVDPVQYAIRLLIPPGSAILDLPDTAEWLGPLDAAAYTYRWDHPDRRMDRLHQEVSALVEAAASRGADDVETFYAIWDLAAQIAGALCPAGPTERSGPPAVPGLTEAWFC
jgi:radical SAM superfamily enzyme YgiQ (UPF0313 family)